MADPFSAADIFKDAETKLADNWPKENAKQSYEHAEHALKYLRWVLREEGNSIAAAARNCEAAYKKSSPAASAHGVGSLLEECYALWVRIDNRKQINKKGDKLVQEITGEERNDLNEISGLLFLNMKEYDAHRKGQRRSTAEGHPSGH